MVLGDTHKFTKMNCHYSTITHKLHIYDGFVTDEIIKYVIIDNRQISIDKNGEIYITWPPTYMNQ